MVDSGEDAELSREIANRDGVNRLITHD